jgi:NAD(P)-dependent dehydrogenase (short-subunit alcohol dehydrogenase family)
MNIPERIVDPRVQMYPEALGTAPGRQRMQGRHLLVVGAGQRASDSPDAPVGNGRAIAMLAAREGASVVCADVNEASARETVGYIEGEGGRATALAADVARPEDVKRMLAEARQQLGQLDGVAINVGISHGMPLDKLTPEIWDRDFAVNLRGHMLICQEALRIMEPGSSIVLMSSLASQRPTGRNPAYETSKAALLALGRSVALAGQPTGIRCNVVAPGLIDTPMGRAATARRPDRAASVPFGRQGTGWEVAYAVLFLLSHESSYVNAHTLFVDGGHGRQVVL